LTCATTVACFQITDVYWPPFATGVIESFQAVTQGQLVPEVGLCQVVDERLFWTLPHGLWGRRMVHMSKKLFLQRKG